MELETLAVFPLTAGSRRLRVIRGKPPSDVFVTRQLGRTDTEEVRLSAHFPEAMVVSLPPVIRCWFGLLGRQRGILCALVAGLLLFGTPTVAQAQIFPGLFAKSERTPPTQPHPSVARIVVTDKDGTSYGSGTLIDARDNVGLVVTNWHVVTDAAGPIQVIFPDGFQSPARVLKVDKDWDLAALAIWKPTAPPVPISTTVPRPGDPLAIAGYGSGDWRLAAGKCTQYVAPAENLPYEMVEVSAEARQGDSGGPIFNSRGELAGVLFGASRGTTSGSYSGRVRLFLEPIIAGAAANDAVAANVADSPRAVPPADKDNVTTASSADVQPSPAVLKPPPGTEPLADPAFPRAEPIRGEQPALENTPPLSPDESITPHASAINLADDDPQFATRRGPGGLQAIERRDFAEQGLVYTPLPPRGRSSLGISTSMNNAHNTSLGNTPSTDNLWQQLAGNTPFDQGKSVLAVLGLLTVVYRFLGRDSRSDDDGEE